MILGRKRVSDTATRIAIDRSAEGRESALSGRLSVAITRHAATITRDTSKATSALKVSFHLLALPSHGKTRLLESMHACLNVDEIVRHIAGELVLSAGKAAAVALACCRKSLEDPVLDTLWETQNRLFWLLRTFPDDVWNKDGGTVSAPTIRVFPFLQ